MCSSTTSYSSAVPEHIAFLLLQQKGVVNGQSSCPTLEPILTGTDPLRSKNAWAKNTQVVVNIIHNGTRNGFAALAEFDKAEQGGNLDGLIGSGDAIYESLLLWQDVNHNGISEAEELHGLSTLGVEAIELDYRESSRRDAFDNVFRFRAKVYGRGGNQLGRWAYDVFLVPAP